MGQREQFRLGRLFFAVLSLLLDREALLAFDLASRAQGVPRGSRRGSGGGLGPAVELEAVGEFEPDDAGDDDGGPEGLDPGQPSLSIGGRCSTCEPGMLGW